MERDKDLAEETGKHPSSLSPCLQQELCPLPAGTGDRQAGHQPSCQGTDAGLLLLKINPGGMLKTRLKNTFPRTTRGFFPPFFPGKSEVASDALGARRSCSLSSLSARYDHVQSQGHVLPVSPSPLPWYLRAGHAGKAIWGLL